MFWRDGKDPGGWVLGLSFLCSVVCFVFLLTYLFFGFITSCCISLLYVIKIPNDFLLQAIQWSLVNKFRIFDKNPYGDPDPLCRDLRFFDD
jgi:hypothetical protein